MRSPRIRIILCRNSFRSSGNNNFYLKHIIIITLRIDGNGRRASCVCTCIVLSPRAAAAMFVVVSSCACACVRLSVFMGLCMRIIICRHSSGQRWLGRWPCSWGGGVEGSRRRQYNNNNIKRTVPFSCAPFFSCFYPNAVSFPSHRFVSTTQTVKTITVCGSVVRVVFYIIFVCVF